MLRMRRDRDDGDDGRSLLAFDFIGAVVPKDAVSAGRVVLHVSFEQPFLICASQGTELVSVKTWVTEVGFQITEGFPNLFEDGGF